MTKDADAGEPQPVLFCGRRIGNTGNADTAIAQFNKSLTYDPKKADTLFNLGIVKWQGKKDGPGAVAAWKKLLETNPACPDKDAVLQLMAQAHQHCRSFLAGGNIRPLVFRSWGNPADERPRE